MHRHAFARIVHTLENYSPYFQMRYDASRKRGLSSSQKGTVAL